MPNRQNNNHPMCADVPNHIAIIMDGNGRWAKRNSLSLIEGHRLGAQTAKKIILHSAQVGVNYLTLYTFSSENWKRSQKWIEDFLGLLRWYLKTQINDLKKHNIAVRFIGDLKKFPTDIQKLLIDAKTSTKGSTGMVLNIALGYGGRDEWVKACQNIARKALKKELDPISINHQTIADHLYTKGCPDPDLLIRTSGEYRLSNFLLWQMAYTELYFSDKLWPDFNEGDFDKAIDDFRKRHRRYGL